jgi:hypothetical protein
MLGRASNGKESRAPMIPKHSGVFRVKDVVVAGRERDAPVEVAKVKHDIAAIRTCQDPCRLLSSLIHLLYSPPLSAFVFLNIFGR